MGILLSILVPAYQYPEGIDKILSRTVGSLSELCELIVHDDSPGSEVLTVVQNYLPNNYLTYSKNVPAKGAVPNWNSLIDVAKGEYVCIMHHDEFPFDNSFIASILNKIKENEGAEVFLLDCLLFRRRSRVLSQHLSMPLRLRIAKHFPEYLFRRNVIGPTASLIIRKDLGLVFDAELKWLVDVDFYYRILQLCKKVIPCSDVAICSVGTRAGSITSTIRKDIAEIEKKEKKLLMEKYYSSNIFWLGPFARIDYGLFCFESILWALMRLVSRCWNKNLNVEDER